MSNSGVFGLLESAASRGPESVFLTNGERSVTFREAGESSRRLAGWLAEQGVSGGDRVAICMRNRPELAIAVFAAALLNAPFVVLNPKLRPKGLSKILAQAEPGAVIADGETIGLFAEETGAFARLAIDAPDNGTGQWCDWETAFAGNSASGPEKWTGIDVDAATLVFTSGSTADPRGVTLSHDNIRFVVSAIQERLQYRADDSIGCFLPLAFDYGLYQIFLAAQAGSALFVGDPAQVGPILPSILRQAGITVLPGVPTVYAALIAMHDRRPFELPTLRAATNTGERLPPAYIERLESMFPGIGVYPMYGLTECKRVSILLPEERKTRPNSVGRALAGTEVYAADDAGNRLPPGEAGELVVRGRHVGHGYWRAPEETARRYRKRAPESAVELFTGDRGSVDREGFIYFAARADDLLKHRGNRISPVEIENEACAVPGVIEACVLKRSSDDTLHLFVTLSDPSLTGEAILGYLAATLEPAKVPEFVVIETELPKSINGKIDRKTLQQALENTARA